MTIDTFSFDMPIRQGLWNGFAITRQQGLWIDRCDGAMQAETLPDDGGGAGRAGEIIRAHKLTNGMISASWIYVCAAATAGRFM